MAALIAVGALVLALAILAILGWTTTLEDDGRIGRLGRIMLTPLKLVGWLAMAVVLIAIVGGFVGILYTMGHG